MAWCGETSNGLATKAWLVGPRRNAPAILSLPPGTGWCGQIGPGALECLHQLVLNRIEVITNNAEVPRVRWCATGGGDMDAAFVLVDDC
jgi:hypothetical protein